MAVQSHEVSDQCYVLFLVGIGAKLLLHFTLVDPKHLHFLWLTGDVHKATHTPTFKPCSMM